MNTIWKTLIIGIIIGILIFILPILGIMFAIILAIIYVGYASGGNYKKKRLLNNGVKLLNQRKYEDSLECFDKALKIDPNFAYGW
jgi:tetratricopeptide (TPR) repeat protein